MRAPGPWAEQSCRPQVPIREWWLPEKRSSWDWLKGGCWLTPVAGCLLELSSAGGKGTDTALHGGLQAGFRKGAGLGVLNLAPAYFVVNYSDVNCIVNKASTFLSFPISVIKCVGAGLRGAKVGSWVEAAVFGFQNEGPVKAWPGIWVRQEDWSPPRNSRVEDGGGVMAHSLGYLHFSPLSLPPANCLYSSSKSCKSW